MPSLVVAVAFAGSYENPTSKRIPHLDATYTTKVARPSKSVFSSMNFTPGTVMLPRFLEVRLILANLEVVVEH